MIKNKMLFFKVLITGHPGCIDLGYILDKLTVLLKNVSSGVRNDK